MKRAPIGRVGALCAPVTIQGADLGLCKICRAPGQVPRRRELQLGDVSLEIEMPMCAPCADELPYKILEALQSPIVRSMLKVLGVTFDLDLAAELGSKTAS